MKVGVDDEAAVGVWGVVTFAATVLDGVAATVVIVAIVVTAAAAVVGGLADGPARR